MSDFSFWDIVRNLAVGLQWTLLLSLVAFVGGGLIGLLVMTMRISRKAFARNIARTYIELFQGTPLLMQLFLVFFGIALLGVDISPWLAAAIALTLLPVPTWPRSGAAASNPSPTGNGKRRPAWHSTRLNNCAT